MTKRVHKSIIANLMSSETSPRTFFLAHVVSRATLVDASNANAGGGLTFEDVYSTYAVEAMLGP